MLLSKDKEQKIARRDYLSNMRFLYLVTEKKEILVLDTKTDQKYIIEPKT